MRLAAASLDFGNQMMVLSRVKTLAAQGYGIVLSTQDPDHALLIASRPPSSKRPWAPM